MSLRDTLLALQPQQPNGTTYSALGTTAQPLPDPLQDERDFGNPLTRGLGQAVRGVKGSTKAYVASALDATGHSDAAKGWWDSAAQDAQRAAYVGPDVKNLGQVHDADTALQYALGAVGKGAAYIPPAMAGAVAGRMGLGRFMNPNLAATLGGAAVMHPTMAGGVAQELHEDSAAAGMSPQEKFARANLVGGTQGAVMAAVPDAMTGRMLTPVPVNSLKQALLGAGVQTAKSAAEAGAAVGASDVIGQAHKMQYDPNAKFDPMRVADAAAQGALGMAPVGAVHGAVAHGVDLVASGGRLAAKGGIALSDTAMKAANGAADPLRTVGDAFNAYRTHPELATLMADQRLPAELVNAPDEQVNAWAASNENMQREAALAIARRTVADPNAPAQSVAVAQHLLDNANDPEAWKPFVGGLVAQERSRRVGENIREAAGELVSRLGGAKQNLEPTRDDEVFLSRLAPDLDSTFGSPLTEHVRNTAAGVLKDYVLGDFGRDDNGNVTVPHGLTAAFGAGAPEIIGKAYDLLRRQGRTQEIDEGVQAALADIQSLVDSRVPQYKRASQAVWDNLTPEAMDALPAEDYPHIADSIRRYIDGGKKIPDVEAQLDQWFGANKDKVLAQIDLLHERNRLQGESYGDESAATPNRGESDAAAKDYESPLQERESSYAYHFGDKEGRPFDLANDYVGDHIQRVERNLDTERYNARYDKSTGREVVSTEPVGIVDYAKATGDNRQLDALRQQHETEYETRGSRGLDQMLNDRYKVLRSQERTNDQPEAVEIRPDELNAPATVGGRANKRAWSDVTKLGQRDVSTIADGRIFLPEGEPGGKKYGKDFVTSAQKLISKMWERKGQGAFDERTAEQTGPKDMLNMFSAGLSSLLNSGKFQGEMRVRMADGTEHVVNGMKSLPDDFALFRRADGSVLTLGEARRSISEEVGRAVVDEGRIARDPQTKQPHIYDSEKEALGHVDKEAGQFVGKYGDNFAVFEKKGAELPQDKVRETAGPKGHAITETDEMSMQANKKLDATERNFDELTGAELHPKEGKLDQRARRLDGLRREYAEKVTKIKELEAAPANAVRDGKLRLLKSQTSELVKQGKELAAEYKAAAAKADGKKFNAEPARKLLDSPRFNAWFGDSKMRTKDGAPVVFYHSSDAAFDTFDPARAGANTNHASAGLGIFVSPSAERSAVYGQHTMPLYVRMERPYRMSLEEFSSFADLAQSKARARALQAQGYDGVFVPTDGTTIVFDPTQLKATDNNGNFSAFDANTKRSDEPLGAKASAEELKAANDYITKTLGPAMHREFVDAFGHGGSGEWEQGVVRVATSALNPLSVAYHESMHELFSRLTEAGRGKDAETLLKAASSPITLRRLERFFADDKFEAVREAIRNDPQERLAYMYQLWASGKMKFGPETQTIFQRVANLIRRITGMLTNDQRAELILKAFHDGKLAEPNEMAKALDGIAARGDTLRAVAKKIDPVLKRGQELVGTAEAQLTGSANPYLNQIGRLFNNKVGATDKDQGFLQAHVQANNQWLNRFGAAVRDAGEHVEKADLDTALEALQTGTKAKDRVARKIQDGVQRVFDEMHEYLRGADVRRYDAEKQQWEPLGKIVNYFPRAWDSAALVRDGAVFKDRLLKFHADELEAIAAQANKEVAAKQDAGELTASWRALQDEKTTPVTAEDVAAAILDRLIGSDGQAALDEMPNALGYSPFMKAVNERTLDWIDMRQFHDFQQKDLMQVLSSYVGQATKRAEYTRTFGYDGGKLQASMEGAWAHEINQIAEREYGVKDAVGQAKALDPEAWQKQLYSVLVSGTKTELTPQDAEALPIRAAKSLEPARRAVMAMEGTLGHDISPLLRKASAYSIVYQNTRLLAYAMFSNLIDPLGIVVRGGEMKDAFVAFKRGMSAIVKEWGDLTGLRERKPEDYDEATRVAEMVGTVDCAGFMSTMGNLYGSQYLPAWAKRWNDNFFRWNGMEAYNKAMRVQATQAAIGFIKRHAENPGEHSERYLKELGITKADVRVQDGRLNTDSPAIQKAIMRWVDGAILRPNAAIRPSWSSDPHFAVFFHLKQFMYATHEVLLKRVVHEVKNGNTNPLLLLAAGYVPVMLAADAAKGILQEAMGAGAPVWEHEGVAGIVAHGVQRAGLLGTGQMALDAKEFGVPGLLGPTAEQIASAFTQPAADSLKEAVGVGPLNFVVKGMAWND